MAGKKQGPGEPGGKAGPQISEEDRALWRKVTRDAKPLEKPKPAAEAAAPSPKPKAAAPAKAALPSKPATSRPPPAGRPRTPEAPPLESGRAAGLDRRNLERLRRGKLPIEATLDLHGDRQAEAHQRLDRFLAAAQAAGKRCVLVITGKGNLGRPGNGRGTGVIRSNLPRWLNEPPNRDRVLAFAQAQAAHGGAGAFYVLLKRKR